MEKETIIIKPDSNGYLTCKVPITKEQWLELLHDKGIFNRETSLVVLSFYFMPDRKASCAQCSEKYGYNFNTYNRGISTLGQRIISKLGTFSVVDESGKECFWPVAIGRGRFEKIKGIQQFVWQLREELCEAIEEFLLEDAIAHYIDDFEAHWNWELYKWRAVQCFQDNWNPEADDFASMLDKSLSKTGNLLNSQSSFARGMIVEMAQIVPEKVRTMFEQLFDENIGILERTKTFLNSVEDIRSKHNTGTWKSHFQSTNTVSIYLWMKYPDKYTIYKYSEALESSRKLGLRYAYKKGSIEAIETSLQMYDWFIPKLKANQKVVDLLKQRIKERNDLYPDPEFKTASNDLGFWISRYYKSKEEFLYHATTSHMTPFIKDACELLKAKKNLIIQGAPGTGKTHNTAAIAVYMIDGKLPGDHKEVMDRYEQLQKAERIGFATFHQSMDYEDFIEGYRPRHKDGQLYYEREDGIFKRLCEAAQVASDIVESGADDLLKGVNENPTIWKVSLVGTGDNPIRKDCMDNGYIRIGWGCYGDKDFMEDNPDVTEGKNILRAFQNDMRIGDIVVSCWSQDETDAIGIITGDYEYRAEGGDYNRYREVNGSLKVSDIT